MDVERAQGSSRPHRARPSVRVRAARTGAFRIALGAALLAASGCGHLAAGTARTDRVTASGARPEVVGATGVTGPTGAKGSVGVRGATGVNGATGSTGAAGIDGTTGATGMTGAPGADGTVGAAGPAGMMGPTGEVGATGATGAAGADGTDGVAGPDGAMGPIGPAGVQGATGATGADGADGRDGVEGPDGPAGRDGVDGATGSTGPQGATGTSGVNSFTLASTAVSVAGLGSTTATVSCPSGSVGIAPAWDTTYNQVRVLNVAPVGAGTTWSFRLYNGSSTPDPSVIRLVCVVGTYGS